MSTATATIDRIERQGYDGWKQTRRTLIGASEAPAILGCGYSTVNAWTIWAIKRGLLDETPDTQKLRLGRRMQPVIAAEFEDVTGLAVTDLGEFTIQRHPVLPWLGATLDGLIEDTPDGAAVWEAKNVDAFLRGDWKGDEPPLRVNVQVQAQLECTGLNVAYVAGLIGGNRLVVKRVLRDQRFIDAMLPHLAAFWRLVEEGIPPPIDGSAATAETLRRLHAKDNGRTVTLGEDFEGDFDELLLLKESQAKLKQRREYIENRFKAAIGDATEAVLPNGHKMSWKTQDRKAYTKVVPAGSYRVLRQHEHKGPDVESSDSRVAEATAALLAHGATLYHESESGSRYFELTGGLRVRVSDHEPNKSTAGWIDRHEVSEVRVDLAEWREQLTAIVGPEESENDE